MLCKATSALNAELYFPPCDLFFYFKFHFPSFEWRLPLLNITLNSERSVANFKTLVFSSRKLFTLYELQSG